MRSRAPKHRRPWSHRPRPTPELIFGGRILHCPCHVGACRWRSRSLSSMPHAGESPSSSPMMCSLTEWRGEERRGSGGLLRRAPLSLSLLPPLSKPPSSFATACCRCAALLPRLMLWDKEEDDTVTGVENGIPVSSFFERKLWGKLIKVVK